MPEYATFARNVFIPVTNICRNNCHYCTFRREPSHPDAQLMGEKEIGDILSHGKKAGCTEALFVFGEYAEEVPEYMEWLEQRGYSSTVNYVYKLCEMAIGKGLLPHTNAGILTYEEMEVLKPVNASMGLMLETTARLPAHELSPGKEPKIRLRMIEDAGKLHIPFTTGILVGIGETRENRIDSLETIAEIQLKYGHIQEVIIQNFMPKPGTRMESIKPPSKEEMLDTVQLARSILPADVEVQVAPNLIDPYLLIKAGAKDLGGISPTTIDWINPEAEWPDVEKLKTMARDVPLKERLPIYPQYIRSGWYSKQLDGLINSLANSEGYRK